MFMRPFVVNSIMIASKPRTKFSGIHRMFSNSKEIVERLNILQFTNEENQKILNMINTKNLNELICYNISKGRALKILKRKEQNGDFKTMDELIDLDGFGINILSKFYKSLLDDKPIKKSHVSLSRKASAFIVPGMPEEVRKSCKSIVSIRVGVSNVTWSRLELSVGAPTILTHWQHHDIDGKKLHLLDLIKRCLYLDYLIPEADCYVFENPQIAQTTAPGSTEQININIQKSQLLSTLGLAVVKRNLNETKSEMNHSCVFYMKRFLTARLFNTLVGTERISTEQRISELMTPYHINDQDSDINDEDSDISNDNISADKNQGNIYFTHEFQNFYQKSIGYQKEFLGQTLLLNVAFLRLVLLKCAKSVALVSRSRNSESN